MIRLFSLVCFLVLLAPLGLRAEDPAEYAPLQKAAVAEFVKLANTLGSEIAEIIARYNAATTDGRNSQGTIALPVTASAVSATLLEAQTIHVPFHYGNVEDGVCYAEDLSATVLLTLSAYQEVHYATIANTLAFKVSARNILRFKRQGEYCEENFLTGSENGTLEVKSAIEVDEPREFKIGK